jgi:GAF domain-containing protein
MPSGTRSEPTYGSTSNEVGTVDGRAVPKDPTRQLAAMLAVSRVVAEGGPLRDVLDRVAREAKGVMNGRSASILLLRRSNVFRLLGADGLSDEYRTMANTMPVPLTLGHGPSGLASAVGHPVMIADTETDERFAPWRRFSRFEGYRALLSVPLRADDTPLGALNIYRSEPGPYEPEDVALLEFFAQHASSAIWTAQLIQRQSRQLSALQRVVRSLRAQTHEHANRLHAIGGMLALGEYEEAQRFVAGLEAAHHASYSRVGLIENPTLAGLVLAETAIAHQRGIQLNLGRGTRLRRLPPSLGDAEAVTIVGNLLQNAFDAVADVSPSRRKVTLTIRDDDAETRIAVRDWGAGVPLGMERLIFERGFTTKSGHVGAGLSLVADAVAASMGSADVDRLKPGTVITITIPHADLANAHR